MDSTEKNTDKSSPDDSSSTNTNEGATGRTDTDNLQWNAEDLEAQASEESCDDGEESDYSSTDSDGFSEKCPICLQRFSGQEIGTPETCEHYFCLECITKWSNKTATCPVDRKSFPSILVRRDLEGEVVRIQEVVFPNQNPNPEGEQYDFDPTYCEICGLCDREDRLLLCDGCDLGYHLECLEPRLEYVPIDDWFCPRCQATHRTPEAAPTSSREASHRSVRVARTSQSIRILHSIARSTTNDLVMETSAMEELAMRRSTASSRNSSRSTQRRRKPTRKAQKSKTKSKSAKRKTRSSGRTASAKRPSSIRRRLLQQLRIIPPRPGQVYVGLPNCRGSTNSTNNSASSSTSSLSSQRFHAGITPLRLYDSYDDLESYDHSGEDVDVASGELGIAAPVRHRIGLPMRNKFGRSSRDIAPPASLSGRVDILGPILNRQFILHHDRNIHITRDGTLIPSLPADAANLHFQKTSPAKKPGGPETNNNNSGTRNNNSGPSSSNSPPRNGTQSPDSNARSPFSSNHNRNLPSSVELNEYTRQTPSSPNGTNSTSNAAGTSFINSTSNNATGSGQPASTANVFDGGSTAHAVVPPWEADSNSRNDNDFFSAATNIFPLCKATPDSKPKSDDENPSKDNKANSKRPQNSKSFPESRHNNDDDEDYNIYSDIEEVPEEVVVEKKTKRNASQDNDSEVELNRDRERDSDSEMVIDEENAKIRRNSLEKDAQSRAIPNSSSLKPVELPATLILDPVENVLPGETANSMNSMEEYNLPSPESIPLPDSPPPTCFEAGSVCETEVDSPSQQSPFLKVRNDILDSVGKGKSALREEYDPSQPLDSSDEEEHSMQLTKRNSLSGAEEDEVEKEEVEIPIPASPPQTQSIALVPKPVREIVDDDLNSIPMPPTEDYRRPTIQFSIPTRHRLLPISSLIKRQKGVVRKESKNGNAMSFQSEISKIFGDDKGEESGGDWSKLGDSSEEKLSLVAEIFGSDDEEGDALPEHAPAIIAPPNVLQTPLGTEEDFSKLERVADLDKLNETAASSIPTVANSRWKTIAEPILISAPEVSSEDNNLSKPVEESVVEEIDETPEIEVVAVKEAEVVVISNVTKVKLKESQAHYQSKSSESPPRKEAAVEDIDNGTGDKSNSSLESISDEDSFDSDSSAHRNGEGGKPRRKREAPNGKSHKRKRSHSLTSNCEEGEIVDVPEKKKKKGKKKKSKKRKKSKESRSPSVMNFTEKKIPDAQTRHSSSDELEEGSKPVSWRKPSKSTKQRNYRDGKPKAEEKYFRENDKHREVSPRERRERDKHPKEKSPVRENKRERSKERTESRRTPDESKNHSSRSKSHRWRSRSRSASKSRKDKHYGSPSGKKPYSSRSESRNSPLRHSRRHRRSKSPGRIAHSRSHSRSPGKFRSHSPTGKSRRRSRSDSRSRRNKRRRSVSSSSSRSISSKRSKGRRKDKFGGDDRLKKRRDRDRDKDKEREKEKEKEKEKEREREKVVEVRETKDKKKKRKRREKSVSPVKAIVADGDSIVVSLNFQKGKDSSSTNNAESTNQNKSDDTSKRKSSKSKNGRSGEKESGKPKLLKKTVLIDLEASPIQEQNIGVSPTVIVLSDDDECVDSQSKEKDTGDKHTEDKNSNGTVTNSAGGVSAEAGERCSPYRHGVPADSTQVQPQSTCKIGDASFSASMSTSGSPDEGSNGSLMRDDSVVTSTRVETAHPPDEESMNSSSPSSKSSKGKMPSNFQPVSPKVSTPLPLSPTTFSNRNESSSTPSTTTAAHKSNGQTLPAASTSLGMAGKPVIGNIPGLFPSKTSTMSGGNVSVPSPIVIPAPPTPQLRFPAMNPTLLNSNVLVSVASAIYGPLLAARQQSSAVRNIQPNQMAANTLGNVIANKNNLQGSVLLPKNQNFHTFNSRTNNISTQPAGDGDSPFSPNSSEGDDLFEPPNERGQLESVSSSKNDKNASVNSAPAAASGHIGGGNSAPGVKGKSNIFDSLFGASPNKSVHNKMQDRIGKIKSASHQKAKGHRQTVKKEVKLSEGELRLSEDVPTSAVELRVKEKFLKKLNRQERVVEEVKLSLKPHYSKKHITKEEYKEILRKAVPKICHNKSGEINPNKIKELVEAYVKKFRHSRKKE